jgi:hypothetical protein
MTFSQIIFIFNLINKKKCVNLIFNVVSMFILGNGVYEILLLMPFYKVHLLNLMNSR